MRKIVIEIDADWIESLCETQDREYIEYVLSMLIRHDDVLYDYMDDAIREMIERDEIEREME